MPYIDVRRWDGSLATSIDIEDLAPGDFVVLRDFLYDQAGFPTVRGGRTIYNSHTAGVPVQILESAVVSSVQGLYHFTSGWTSGPSIEHLITYAGTKLYKSEMDAEFDEILTGLERDLQPSFCTLRGWMIFASGSQKTPKPYFWVPGMATAQKLENAPNASIVAAHSGRLWIADRDYPSRLWFSAPYEPNNWNIADGAGFLLIGPGDGSNISALVPGFAGEMIVFKDGVGGGSTYRIQGLAQPFSVSPLSTTIGAISHRCATMVGDKDIFFASRRGIHSLKRVFEFGDLETKFLDYEVSERWRELPDQQKLRALAVDDYPRDTWWIFVDQDNDGVNDTGWLFNYRHQGPRQNPKISDVSFGAQSAVIYRDQREGRELLLTGGSDGYVRVEHAETPRDETASGGLADVTWQATLAPLDAGDSFAMKSWIDLWLKHDNWGYGDIQVTWFGDNRPPSTSTITMNPADAKVPYLGVRLNEIRGFPPKYRSTNLVRLHEGGVALNLSLSGTRGKIRLKGFRLGVQMGRMDVSADRWLAYTATQPPV